MALDPLAAERIAYLAASRASMDATLDAAAINREPPSPQRAARVRVALSVMVDRQVDALAAHDRFATRGQSIGMDRDVLARLRAGRADLALQLQRTIAALANLEETTGRNQGEPTDTGRSN